MNEDTLSALAAPPARPEEIARWIKDVQRIANERAQVEAAYAAAKRILDAKLAELDEQQKALDAYGKDVLQHFQAREREERRGRSFASIEDGYVVRLKKQPQRIVAQLKGSGDFFNWDNLHEKKFSRWKIKATLTNEQFERFKLFIPEAAAFAEREPATGEIKQHFQETGELPPEFELVGGEDKLYVEMPKLIQGGSAAARIEQGEEDG